MSRLDVILKRVVGTPWQKKVRHGQSDLWCKSIRAVGTTGLCSSREPLLEREGWKEKPFLNAQPGAAIAIAHLARSVLLFRSTWSATTWHEMSRKNKKQLLPANCRGRVQHARLPLSFWGSSNCER